MVLTAAGDCLCILILLLSGMCVCDASSCKALSSFYFYKTTTIRSEPDGAGCSPYTDQPYVLCDESRLTDGDLGPECNLSHERERFYIWDRMYSEGDPGEDRLLFKLRTTVSLTTIQLHYYSQLNEGIGLPTLTFYAVHDAFQPWDAITSPTVTRLASTGPSGDGETPGLKTVSIDLVNASYKMLLVVITYSGSDNISLFYLSEVEFFTCDPGSLMHTSPVQCTPSSSSVIVSSIPTITAVTSTIPTLTNHPLSTSDSDLKLKSTAVTSTNFPTVTTTEPNAATEVKGTDLIIVIGGSVAAICVCILVGVAITAILITFYWRQRKRQKRKQLAQNESDPQNAVYAVVNKDKQPEIPLQNFDPGDHELEIETSNPLYSSIIETSPATGQVTLPPPSHQCEQLDNPYYSTVQEGHTHENRLEELSSDPNYTLVGSSGVAISSSSVHPMYAVLENETRATVQGTLPNDTSDAQQGTAPNDTSDAQPATYAAVQKKEKKKQGKTSEKPQGGDYLPGNMEGAKEGVGVCTNAVYAVVQKKKQGKTNEKSQGGDCLPGNTEGTKEGVGECTNAVYAVVQKDKSRPPLPAPYSKT